jgi:GntR family transcriptional regulator, transcriptional repressor for pyruvate dehydrogenase complex
MSQSVADSAVTALRALLARGQYQPGDRLPPERDLASGLGLSRPTLREAIRRLTEAGILESRRGSGTYVADIDLAEVFSVRLQLEPFAARLAAIERSGDDARRLSSLVRALRDQLDDVEAFSATDLEIHRAIATMSRNAVLVGLLERLTELTQLSRAVTSPARDARLATLREMRQLARAVRMRNPDLAAETMAAHIRSMREVASSMAPPDRRVTPDGADLVVA